MSREARRLRLPLGEVSSLDLKTGWDFRRPEDRRLAWWMVEQDQPEYIILSPECRAFSTMFRSNWSRMDPRERQEVEIWGMETLLFCAELAWHQIQEGRYFVFEHPLSASSWQTESLQLLAEADGVSRVEIDMCAFGLQVGPDEYSKKPTAILTNCEWVRKQLEGRRCDKTH